MELGMWTGNLTIEQRLIEYLHRLQGSKVVNFVNPHGARSELQLTLSKSGSDSVIYISSSSSCDGAITATFNNASVYLDHISTYLHNNINEGKDFYVEDIKVGKLSGLVDPSLSKHTWFGAIQIKLKLGNHSVIIGDLDFDFANGPWPDEVPFVEGIVH